MSEETNQKQEKVYTSEEIAALKKRQIDYYNDQLPLLKLQAEVEEYKAKINVARLNSLKASLEYLQIEHDLRENAEELEKEESTKAE